MPLILNGTTGISGVDGSAGTPSYQGTDTNTGIFYPAADTIAFAEGGAEIARFDSSGNLLVNTTTASYSAINRGNITIGGTASAILGFQKSGVAKGYVHVDGSDEFQIWNESNTPMYFGTNATERMRITSSGNVGIGTNSPATLLNLSKAVSGGVGPEIRLNNNAGAASDAARISLAYLTSLRSAFDMQVSLGGAGEFVFSNGVGTLTERMRITSDGNVGIGISSPAATLDVTRNQAAATAINVLNDNASGSARIRVGFNASNCYDIFRIGNSADIIQNATQSTANIIWQTNGTERMRITSGGRVGIGTTTPGEVLAVNGKAQATTFYGGNSLTCAVVNTWYKVQDGYFGLYVFRDASLGGNAALLYDGSTGATIFSSSIANFEGRNNAGNLEVRVTANAPRNLYWACLSTVSS